MKIDISACTEQFSDDYLGGFFDGEGCLGCTIRLRKRGLQWQAYASVNVGGCLPVLAAFQRRFGGSVHGWGITRINGDSMHTWRMQAGGQEMAGFCEWVIQHCWYKRRIAEILFPVCKAQPERRWGGHAKRRTPPELAKMRAIAFKRISLLNSGKSTLRSPHYQQYIETYQGRTN